MNTLSSNRYIPDVLLCLANLSNDEVLTSPEIANKILDMLPQELFSNPDIKFLDPACKSGIFLREIAKRLIRGLENTIPDLQERLDHIFQKQLYGIAITELTSILSRRSVYCSKFANSLFSVCKFNSIDGNILYHRINHVWQGKTCRYCGAIKTNYDRNKDLENYAYEFIHVENPKEIINMKFDVIISNPPYQINDGGNGKSAKPIYQKFVEQAKSLNPTYMSMIIPSRWFTGGKGLEGFRRNMLTDKRIRKLVDYENYKDVFPSLGGLAGGACYFLWDKNYNGKCEVTNMTTNSSDTEYRDLNEFDVLIRSNKAVSIVRKVLQIHHGNYMDKTVSSRKPFGLPTNYKPRDYGVPCQFIQKIGLKYADKNDITDNFKLLNKWKIVVPKSPIAGQTDFSKSIKIYYEGNVRMLPPGTCCTESYIVVFSSDNKEEVESFKSYLFTKIFRFLLLVCVVSQDITKDKYKFVPDLGVYSRKYTDEYLRRLWNIEESEWKYIDSKITSIEY